MRVCHPLGRAIQATFTAPQGFDEVPFDEPVLSVLTGCLCFSYDFRKTEFILWQMKEYRVHESWNQLFKISYQDMPVNYIAPGYPVAIIYNLREYTIDRIQTRALLRIWYSHKKIETQWNITWFRRYQYAQTDMKYYWIYRYMQMRMLYSSILDVLWDIMR